VYDKVIFTWHRNCVLWRWSKLLKKHCPEQKREAGEAGGNFRPTTVQLSDISGDSEVVSTWFKAEVEFLHSSSSSKDKWALIMDLAVTMGINDCDSWALSRRPTIQYAKPFILSLRVQPWVSTDSQPRGSEGKGHANYWQ
jgi:hypothetical protein